MAKQNPNITYQWYFERNMWKAGSVNGLSFLLQLFPAVHQVLLFYKGIFFIKHCVIVTSYYVTDSQFIKSCILV